MVLIALLVLLSQLQGYVKSDYIYIFIQGAKNYLMLTHTNE